MTKRQRAVLSTLTFYALASAVVLFQYPFWRHVSYREYPGVPDMAYRRAALASYCGLAALITLFGFLLPAAAASALKRTSWPKTRVGSSVVIAVSSLLLLNIYFFYSGVYEWGKPLPFPIHFDSVMFFAEFQFLNLVFVSPILALGAACLTWWWRAPRYSD